MKRLHVVRIIIFLFLIILLNNNSFAQNKVLAFCLGQRVCAGVDICEILSNSAIIYDKIDYCTPVNTETAALIRNNDYKIIFCDHPPQKVNPKLFKEFVFNGGVLVIFHNVWIKCSVNINRIVPYLLYTSEGGADELKVNPKHPLFRNLEEMDYIDCCCDFRYFSRVGNEWTNIVDEKIVEASYGKGHIIALAIDASDSAYTEDANCTIFYDNLIDYAFRKANLSQYD